MGIPIIGDVIELRDSRPQTLDFGATKVETRKYMVFDLQDNALATLATKMGIYKGAPWPGNSGVIAENEKLYCTHLDTTYIGSGALAKEFGGVFTTLCTAYFSWLPLDPYQVADYYDFQPRTVVETIDKDTFDGQTIAIGTPDAETGQPEGVPAFRGGGTVTRVWRVVGKTAAAAKLTQLLAVYNKVNDAPYLNYLKGMWLSHSMSITPLDGAEWEFRWTLLLGDETTAPAPFNANGAAQVGHREWKRYFSYTKTSGGDTLATFDKQYLHRVYDYVSFNGIAEVPKP